MISNRFVKIACDTNFRIWSNIAKNLNITFTYKAAKPSKKSIEDYLHVNCSDRKKVALIGDRILTDIIAGNRCGVYTILVQAIRKDGKPQKKNIMLNIEKTSGEISHIGKMIETG